MQELSGTTVTANSLMGSMDEAFQRTDSAGARSFLTDALGSSIALADSTGTLQTQYTFDPFGNTTQSGSSTTNSFAYTGRELDSTGLYFYRARYYNPQFQRFISEDPIGFGGGDTNLYAYVGNSPTNFTDPTGRDAVPVNLCPTIASCINPLPGRKPIPDKRPGKNPDDQTSSSTDDQRIRTIARGVVSGAGGIGDPGFIAGFYVASAVAAACTLGPRACAALITIGGLLNDLLNPAINSEPGPPQNGHPLEDQPNGGYSGPAPAPISGPPTPP